MADITNPLGISALGGSNAAGVNGTTDAVKKKDGQVDKNEFLQLLVTQLKNQDPLNPMDNQRFSVDLATFSQLEQLISINGKLDKSSAGGDLSSVAAYLGKEVTLAGDKIQFKNGDGGYVKFDLAQDASQVSVDLLNEDGSVKETIDIGELKAGKQTIALTSGAEENGTYGFRINATSTTGTGFQAQGTVAGLVTGFIPGPQPTLLVNGRETDPSEIVEVTLPTGN